MKTPKKHQTMLNHHIKPIAAGLTRRISQFVQSPTVLVSTVLLAVVQMAAADNILVNPLFDLTPAKTGWTTFGNTPLVTTGATYYNAGECPPDSPAESVVFYPPGNTNVANVYGNFSGGINYSGWDQQFPAAPGSTWSAGAYTYASHEDLIGAANNFYYQVNFSDASGNLLSSYTSLVISNLNCAGTGFFSARHMGVSARDQ
jgi:hypothetical protein